MSDIEDSRMAGTYVVSLDDAAATERARWGATLRTQIEHVTFQPKYRMQSSVLSTPTRVGLTVLATSAFSRSLYVTV